MSERICEKSGLPALLIAEDAFYNFCKPLEKIQYQGNITEAQRKQVEGHLPECLSCLEVHYKATNTLMNILWHNPEGPLEWHSRSSRDFREFISNFWLFRRPDVDWERKESEIVCAYGFPVVTTAENAFHDFCKTLPLDYQGPLDEEQRTKANEHLARCWFDKRLHEEVTKLFDELLESVPEEKRPEIFSGDIKKAFRAFSLYEIQSRLPIYDCPECGIQFGRAFHDNSGGEVVFEEVGKDYGYDNGYKCRTCHSQVSIEIPDDKMLAKLAEDLESEKIPSEEFIKRFKYLEEDS